MMTMPEFTGLIPTSFILIVILLLYIFRDKLTRTVKFSFPSKLLLPTRPSTWRIKIQRMLWLVKLAGAVFLLIALAGPKIGYEQASINQSGIAINFLIDRSGSMREGMIYSNKQYARLDTVKLVVSDFVSNRQSQLSSNNSDLISLSSFAGFYEELSPFITDYTGLYQFINSLHIAESYEDGTMIGDAVYQAVLRFSLLDSTKNTTNDQYSHIKSRIIILLTDGQQSAGGIYDPIEAARFAEANGIKVYTIAISNSQNSFFGFARDLFKNNATDLLEKIAVLTGGKFASVESGEELIQVYEKINELEKSNIPAKVTIYEEKYEIFLWIGFALIITHFLLRFFIAERLV